jgi:hypothetical protein
MATKPSYTTFVLERAVRASRDATWGAMLEVISAGGYRVEGDPPPHGEGATVAFTLGAYDLVEVTLSFEPPWRRVYAVVSGAPVTSYQGTTTIRDDGDHCLLVWSYLAEAGEHPGAGAFLERAKQALHTAAERIAALAEGSLAAST